MQGIQNKAAPAILLFGTKSKDAVLKYYIGKS